MRCWPTGVRRRDLALLLRDTPVGGGEVEAGEDDMERWEGFRGVVFFGLIELWEELRWRAGLCWCSRRRGEERPLRMLDSRCKTDSTPGGVSGSFMSSGVGEVEEDEELPEPEEGEVEEKAEEELGMGMGEVAKTESSGGGDGGVVDGETRPSVEVRS